MTIQTRSRAKGTRKDRRSRNASFLSAFHKCARSRPDGKFFARQRVTAAVVRVCVYWRVGETRARAGVPAICRSRATAEIRAPKPSSTRYLFSVRPRRHQLSSAVRYAIGPNCHRMMSRSLARDTPKRISLNRLSCTRKPLDNHSITSARYYRS